MISKTPDRIIRPKPQRFKRRGIRRSGPAGTSPPKQMLVRGNFGGRTTSEPAMANVAELLKRKRTLLERMQEQPDTEQLEKIEHDLKEINDALNRLEAERSDAPPIAQH
jgi:hypothetical protein